LSLSNFFHNNKSGVPGCLWTELQATYITKKKNPALKEECHYYWWQSV